MLQLLMTQLIFEGQPICFTINGDESIAALLNNMRKFEPIWETLPETSFGL